MPEALGKPSGSALPNFEVKRRDELEEAVKASKRNSAARLEDEIRQRTEKNSERREVIRSTAETEKKTALQEETVRKADDTVDKRRGQEKSNPDSGNIINVIA
jgi:hypothetical protein